MADHKTGDWMELIRPGNADLNGTLALAAVAIAGWFYFIMRYAGPVLVLKTFLAIRRTRGRSRGDLLPSLCHLLPGRIIEVVSIAFRPISLSLRLFGNVFGGESLMHAMSGMQKWDFRRRSTSSSC